MVHGAQSIADGDGTGESKALLGDFSSYLDDGVLTRHLLSSYDEGKVREIDVGFAARQIYEMLRWRRDAHVDTILSEDFADLDRTREIYWSGVDREGSPTLVWRVFLHKTGKAGVGGAPGADRYTRYLTYTFEQLYQRYRRGQIHVFLDCTSMQSKNVDSAMLRLAAPVLQRSCVNFLSLAVDRLRPSSFPGIRRGRSAPSKKGTGS